MTMPTVVLPLLRALLSLTLLAPLGAVAQSATTGAVRGHVVNDATGNYVEGAIIALAGSPRTRANPSSVRYYDFSLNFGVTRDL